MTATTATGSQSGRSALNPPATGTRPVAELLVSPATLAFLKGFEGLKLTAYRDAVGVLTIGWGHTGDVQPGQQISLHQAEILLELDANRAAAAVRRRVKVPLTPSQFDALVSFTFNLGEGRLAESTLLRQLNAGDYRGAAEELLRWDKGTVRGHKVALPGLTRRRWAERELFMRGVREEASP